MVSTDYSLDLVAGGKLVALNYKIKINWQQL